MRLFNFIRSRPLVGYIILVIGVGLAVFAVDQASLHRHAVAVRRIDQNERKLRSNTIQFCDEIQKLRVVIQARARSQKVAFRTLTEITAKFPVLAKEHDQFVKAYKAVKIIPIKPCPPF